MQYFRLPIGSKIAAALVAATCSLVPQLALAGSSSLSVTLESFSTTLNGEGDTKVYNSGQLNQKSIAATQSTSYATSAQGYGSMSASTNTVVTDTFGHLAASSFVTADNEGLQAGGEVFAQLTMQDVIVGHGTPEADGYIHLPYSFTLNDTITAAGDISGSSQAVMSFEIFGVGAVSFEHDGTDTDSVPYAGPRTFSGDVLLAPGDGFTLFMILQLAPRVSSGGGPASYDIEASHSLDFHLDNDPLTGGSYITGSGVTYFSSVPEPNALVLLSMGLLGSLAARYRWKVGRI